MRLQFTTDAVALVGSAILALASAYYVRHKSDRLPASMYAVAMVAMFLWAATGAVALTVVDVHVTRVLIGGDIGFASLTVATWCLFCLSYSGYEEWLRWPALAALGAVVAAITVLAVTNPLHDLVFVGRTIDETGGWVQVAHGWGVGLWLAVAVVYAIHAVANGALVRKFRRSRNLYRTFTFLLLLASLTIWGANVLSVTGLSPLPHMMFAPIVFSFWGVVGILALASRRFVRLVPVDRLLGLVNLGSDDVVPLARDFVVEGMESGVIVLDARDYVVDVNAMGRRMLGVDGRIVGQSIHDVVDIEAYFGDDSLGGDHREQIWVETDDGRRRCYDVNVSVIGGDAAAVGRAVVMNDVTDQKAREQALRDREQELRTLKQVLSRIIRHNIRNDINVVQGNAEWIARNADADAVASRAEQIVRKADDLATTSRKTRIVDQVVGTSADSLEIDVDSLVADAVADLRAEFPDATIHTDVPSEVAVSGNAYLAAAVENAVENGIVHQNGTAPTVEIEATAEEDTVELTVRDDGPGIPPQEIEAIENGEETELRHASGIGLWLIDWIVGNSGGEVAWSNTDRGTVARIRLPRAD
ncbi:MAG: histidine kinase N-terminal 7TM domain-containing protein [Haloarculaceae archaeon]